MKKCVNQKKKKKSVFYHLKRELGNKLFHRLVLKQSNQCCGEVSFIKIKKNFISYRVRTHYQFYQLFVIILIFMLVGAMRADSRCLALMNVDD